MLLLTKNIMIKSMRNLSFLSTIKSALSYEVLDIKNSHLVYVKDPQSNLPYMSQIITDKGQRGVVIKLQERGVSVIGMFKNIESTEKLSIIKNINNKRDFFRPKDNNIYDINQESIAQIKDVDSNRFFSNKL